MNLSTALQEIAKIAGNLQREWAAQRAVLPSGNTAVAVARIEQIATATLREYGDAITGACTITATIACCVCDARTTLTDPKLRTLYMLVQGASSEAKERGWTYHPVQGWCCPKHSPRY